MQILLVSSYKMAYVTRADQSPPISLLCLAAVLRAANHETHILDLNVLRVPKGLSQEAFYTKTVIDSVRDIQPGMVGLNCLLSAHFPFVRQLATAIKVQQPSCHIIIGGMHPTLFAREILRNCPDIDAIALGEGERQAVALAEVYSKGNAEFLYKINALGFRDKNGQVHINPPIDYITDLDSLPTPAWDLINVNEYYTDHSTWYNPHGLDIKMSVPILTSRSCPYDCNFCSAQKVMGRGLRLRSPKLVVDEMEKLYEGHGLNYFGFVDDNLTLNKQHILTICNEIVRRGMVIQFESFNGYNLNSLDEEIVDAMVRAGCVYVIMPIEHGSDWMRNKIIGKKLPREKIFQVAELYKRYGLLTRGVFIMGFPEDTPETLMETYHMIIDLNLDMNMVFNLIPFPGTKIFQQAVDDRLFMEEIEVGRLWEGLWDLNALQNRFYLHPYRMTLKELEEFRKKFDALNILSRRAGALQNKKQCEERCAA